MKPCIKTYRVILDGDDKAITCFVPATSEQDARQWIEGNGEIIQCKEYELPIDTEYLRDVLVGRQSGHFGEAEADVIVRTLNRFYKNRL